MNPKIKNAMGVLVAVALAVMSLTAIKFVKTYDRVNEPANFRSFSVSAQGKVVAVPDIGQFTFTVITEGGTDIAKLQQDNTKKINHTKKGSEYAGSDT